MTLEESLIFSYLKHIKKCKIVQSNWIPTAKSWNVNTNKADELIRISKNYFKNKYRISIFNNIDSYKDLVPNNVVGFGITFNDDYTQDIYGVIGEFKQNYDDISIEEILEKIFYISINFINYFNKASGNIIFMCPNLNYDTIEKLGLYYFDIKEIFRQLNISLEVSILLNEQFKEEVLRNLEKICLKIDESEDEIYLKNIKFQKQLNIYSENLKDKKVVQNENEESYKVKEENNYNNEKDNINIKEEQSEIIEIEAVMDYENDNYRYIEDVVEEKIKNEKPLERDVHKNRTSNLDIVIDEDTNKILFDSVNNGVDYSEKNHTTSYYMNKRNVKTQFSVDTDSINKIIEERNKKLIEDLLKSKNIEPNDFNDKYQDIKIGELIKSEFNRLFEEEKIPKGEIRKLQEFDYCKKIFGIKYPVLKEVNMNFSLEEQRRDENGNAIYYGFITTIYDKDYYICSIWGEENRHDFLKWLSFFR